MSKRKDSLEAVWNYCQQNNRICPMPQKWNELFGLLKNKRRKSSGGWEPSLPLILAAWHDTPILLKSLRLREHIKWAEDQKQLEEISSFIYSLREDEWLHLKD